MNAVTIALKDLQIFFKDRGAVVQLVALPLIFIVVFSGALAAIGSEAEEDTRIPLPVVDLDGGTGAQAFLDELERAGGVAVTLVAQETAATDLDERRIARFLTIPADFTGKLDGGEQITLRLTNHPDAPPEETEAVRLVIAGAAQDLSLENQILASLRQMGEMNAGIPEENQIFTPERAMAQARSQFERSKTTPLIAVKETVPAKPDGRASELDEPVQLAVPGFTVLFVFLTAQTTARSIYDEKKVGSFRRLLAAPVSKAALLAGKVLPGFIIALIQTLVIFAFGMFGMRLLGLTPLHLGSDPLAVLIVAVAMALCTSCLGIVIAAIAQTENQIGGLSSLILWGAGILGGTFIPLFILESVMGPVIKIVPHYWANHAFNNLLARGLTLGDVVTDLLALGVFSLVFFAIGLWKFDFD
ncbi:MAG: ABC transporter permease [Anaerolineae bacterium]|nr:ABC transporter permease [Anaerolineae bacterium]